MSDPQGLPYNAPFGAQFDPRQLQRFVVLSLLRSMHTATLVQVLAVRPTAGKVGFLDVQPLVLEQDTRGKVLDQAPIYNVPYLRYQGGVSAVILDPAEGDIGLAIFAERDIRGVKATQAAAPAGSDRIYSSADGLYIGGVLNADATQYVEFLPDAAGINIVTPGDLTATVGGDLTADVTGSATLTAPTITLNGDVTVNGNFTQAGGSAAATFAQAVHAPNFVTPTADFNVHKHGGVSTGGGNTGTPHN